MKFAYKMEGAISKLVPGFFQPPGNKELLP